MCLFVRQLGEEIAEACDEHVEELESVGMGSDDGANKDVAGDQEFEWAGLDENIPNVSLVVLYRAFCLIDPL